MSRAAPAEPALPSPRRLLWRRARAHRGLVFAAVVLAVIVLLALAATLVAPHDPYAGALARRRIPPVWHAWLYDHPKAGWTYPLGTDRLGRDYLSRLIHGGRISLLVGVSAMLISGAIGSTLGLLAGYFGGKVDLVVSFFVTTRLSLPVVLVALAVIAVTGSSLLVLVLVLGLLLWDRFAVVMRAATQQARRLDYVAAGEAIGCSTPHLLLREILPNVLNPLIVVATIEMANAILLEAALSFLGLGVRPPQPSWGLMLAEAKEEIFFNSWMIALPGIALFALVLAINLLGDGVRDVTAPENRN